MDIVLPETVSQEACSSDAFRFQKDPVSSVFFAPGVAGGVGKAESRSAGPRHPGAAATSKTHRCSSGAQQDPCGQGETQTVETFFVSPRQSH